MKFLQIMSFTVSLLASASALLAAVVGAPPISTLAAKAEAIVVATVAPDPVVNATSQASTVTLGLIIERVIVGDIVPAGVVSTVWRVNRAVTANAGKSITGTTGLFFLKRGATGEWEVLSQAQPSMHFTDAYIPVPPGAIGDAYAYKTDVPVVEKLLLEIANAAEQSQGREPALQFVHYGLLEGFQSDVPKRLYERLSQSGVAETRAMGIAGMVRRGDPEALGALERESVGLSADRSLPVAAFSIGAYYRNPDPTGVTILGRLARTAALPKLRAAAAIALASIHTKATLPYLALLLEEPDIELASYGIGGLAMFANNVAILTHANLKTTGYQPLPGPAPFRTEETMKYFALGKEALGANREQFVNFWKDWWMQYRTAAMQ